MLHLGGDFGRLDDGYEFFVGVVRRLGLHSGGLVRRTHGRLRNVDVFFHGLQFALVHKTLGDQVNVVVFRHAQIVFGACSRPCKCGQRRSGRVFDDRVAEATVSRCVKLDAVRGRRFDHSIRLRSSGYSGIAAGLRV